MLDNCKHPDVPLLGRSPEAESGLDLVPRLLAVATSSRVLVLSFLASMILALYLLLDFGFMAFP